MESAVDLVAHPYKPQAPQQTRNVSVACRGAAGTEARAQPQTALGCRVQGSRQLGLHGSRDGSEGSATDSYGLLGLHGRARTAVQVAGSSAAGCFGSECEGKEALITQQTLRRTMMCVRASMRMTCPWPMLQPETCWPEKPIKNPWTKQKAVHVLFVGAGFTISAKMRSNCWKRNLFEEAVTEQRRSTGAAAAHLMQLKSAAPKQLWHALCPFPPTLGESCKASTTLTQLTSGPLSSARVSLPLPLESSAPPLPAMPVPPLAAPCRPSSVSLSPPFPPPRPLALPS